MLPTTDINLDSVDSFQTERDSISSTPIQRMNDISGLYENDQLQRSRIALLSVSDKCRLLCDHWLPPRQFDWPFYQKKTQKVFLRPNHITGPKYGCFKLSRDMNGVICVSCALFASESVANDRGKVTGLGQLVQTPLRSYRCLTGKDSSLDNHLNTQYHKTSQVRADNLLAAARTQNNIACHLDSQHKQTVNEQRERLVPIVKTVILCGQMGIAYRGHRDDGLLDTDETTVPVEGNFRALLKFRIDAGDKALESHLHTAGRNATYISKTIQNELINICGAVITDNIIADIAKSKYFTIVCDETTDSGHNEQMCLCVRFVDCRDSKHKIREEFLNFQSADDLTAEGLTNQILQTMASLNLVLANIVGQAYDGATTMSGHVAGVQTRIREKAPLATYVHCSSHVLNLVLNTSSSVAEIRNMFSTVKEVTNFINESSKRRNIFQEAIGEYGGRSLVRLCETRFVERHDALLVFSDSYSSILDALDAIACQSQDRRAVDMSRAFIRAITDPGFIVSLCCARKVMAVTIVLSRSLQKVNQDLFAAMESVEYIQKTLNKWRTFDGEDPEWQSSLNEDYAVFNMAEKLARKADISLSIPRICSRQSQRTNVPADNPSQYFKRAVWLPYLDTILESLRDKFSDHHLIVLKLVALIPSMIDSYSWIDILQSVRFYKSELASEEEVLNEYNQWREFCLKMNKEDRPSTPLMALDVVPARLANINILLHIFCTLPVSTCSAERAFSAMKIIKNYLRNTMKDERLTALALMYIHPEVNIDVKKVIDRFLDKPVMRKFNKRNA